MSSTTKTMKQSGKINIAEDPRFSHVSKDLRYSKKSYKKQKISLDDRFSSMLTDDRFIEKSTMDPRGRPGSFSTHDDLKRLYNLSSESDNDSESDNQDDDDSHEVSESCNDELTDHTSSKELMSNVPDASEDYARGIKILQSDSSDDDSSTTEDEGDDEEEFEWGELDHDAVWNSEDVEVEESNRIAVCNMDWDRVKAKDLMILFSSFLPQGGSILRVCIYLSEYGRERLKYEEAEGPQELLPSADSSDAQSELKDLERLQKGKFTDQSTMQQHEALRKYQRNRLKYYYAVVEFDSRESAVHIYKECDRQPFEGAGVMLDLRYIPTDMEFQEKPKDECKNLPQSYENPIFQTSALMDSKPTLTWDETDSTRRKTLNTVMTKALKKQDYDEDLLKEYIGSSTDDDGGSDAPCAYSGSSDESENADTDRYSKFRALIKGLENKNKDYEDIDKEEIIDNDSEEETERVEREKEKEKEKLTPFEKILEKKTQKNRERKLYKKQKKRGELNDDDEGDATEKVEKHRKRKRGREREDGTPAQPADLDLLLMEEEENDRQHFSMRDIVKRNKEAEKKDAKRKRGKKFIKQKIDEKKLSKIDGFKVDVKDSRFSSIFSSADYTLDPSHPSFKPTGAMTHLIEDIQSKRKKETSEILPDTSSRNPSSLGNLVKKVKRKFK